jgi:hypothetical protein
VSNVYWKTPDDGQRKCPKHVEFFDKNKLRKISASVCFIKNNRDTVGYRKLLVPRRPISCPNRAIVNSVNSVLIMQIMPTLCGMAVKMTSLS